jgi:hypothetical protein
MTRTAWALLCAVALVAGCTDGTEGDEETTSDDSSGITSDRTLPPGSTSPTAASGIYRSEPTDGNDGDGYAANISYDSSTDTFYVEGLGFDGDQDTGLPFNRATPGSLNGFALYEAPATHPDSLTGNPITQMDHRALYGVSTSGEVEFAIVRTGSYTGYGFGGFVYQRNGSVVLPTSGQALYTGQYAALRDFDGAGGLQYASGDMEVAIDFNGFSSQCSGGCAGAVRGYVTNRRYFDTNGNDITDAYLTALGSVNSSTYTELPTLVFTVGPGVLDDNGEITGTVTSTITTSSGVETHESGTYYAILSGDNSEEMVGVLVVESDYPVDGSVTVRETGGFILDR